MANLYDKTINKHIDWNGDINTDNRPVSGRVVQKFIKDTLQSKIGYVHEDLDRGVCLGFADEEDYNLYASNPEIYSNLLIQSWNTSSNDLLYGPWPSIEAACENIPRSMRKRGLTVGIATNSSFEEYQWKLGIEDEDLMQKVEQLILTLHLIGSSSFTKNEGESIFAQFMVDGAAGVKKAVLYQLVNGNEVFVQEYGNIGKKTPYTFAIPNPSVAGVYHYRLRVLDSLDNYATVSENINYIEYTLYYGGISLIYNLTELNAIKVKNYSTIAELPFQLNIAVRDSSFRISSVCLAASDDSNITPKELEPSTGDYLGNNTYYMPDESELSAFNGKQCSIVVTYMEGDQVRSNVKELFRLLDVTLLEIVPEYEGSNYYATLPGYYVFQLQSGVENISVVLTPGTESDFDFERSTVLTYRRFSLRVIPKHAKTNAHIIIRYSYTYNNVEYTGSFDRSIGNIFELPEQSFYEPEPGTVTRDTLIYAKEDNYTGINDGQYYKVISEPVIREINSCSFILDTYCKINQQNNKNIQYLKISYGGVDVATVTEDEIATRWGNLYTDTPINEWTQIGIGINLQETIMRGEQEVVGYYHCIYINGMVVKSVLIDGTSVKPLEYNGDNRLVITIGNDILVQKSFLYFKNDGGEIILPNTKQGDSIIYNNYKSHKLNFEEPQNLPTLKFLRITDPAEISHYFEIINNYKTDPEHDEDPIVHTTTFGTIGSEKALTMEDYDPYYSSSTIESNATLFRQSVEIKKPAQKEYAVLCRAQWMGQEYNDIIVEVHTQGTSTLVYPVPNFKFTFWQVTGNTVSRYCPPFIKKNEEEFYEESIYTAKADFMDSSHLNNTPTCNYYNAMIQNLINSTAGEANPFVGSPSARNGMLDAILGFPIVMEISDNASDFDDLSFINIGSFMLNIDKTGNSLGFEVDDQGQHLSCISFEGTSNDNEHGAAGRFDIPEGVNLKNYLNQGGGVDEAEIISDYNFVKNNITKPKKGPNDTVEYKGQTILVKEQPYIKWCLFLSDGLEYRYPDADMYKEKNGAVSKVMSTDDFIKLYTMWYWVYQSDELSQLEYKSQFVEHFDLDYCMLYFINLMIYAQTDNLGKNAMFDCWDGEHWYPRPYDLDSEAGLDNNGNDNIAPFVEIKPVFSLNYDPLRANDYDWLSANHLIDSDMSQKIYEETELEYPASTIQYGSQTYDRYHFSSNSSKLWITFYKNFKSEINAFYTNLRKNHGYTPESIINLCESNLIGRLGTAQYNRDFQNKYIGHDYQRLGYGNRWYKFKKWLTKRFAFCDSYFGATENAMYNLTSRITYNIKVDAPQYITQQYQGSADTRFVLENDTFNAGSGAATKIALFVNQPSVFETSLFKSATYDNGDRNYKNLITLDVSGNKSSLFNDITTVTGPNLDNLKYLNISNSSVQNLQVPPNIKTLIAENVNLNSIIFPQGCAVEEISFKGTTFLGSVNFDTLPNLKRLDLTDCIFNQGVTFANLGQLEELIMTRTVFSQGVVTISEGVNVTSFDFSGLSLNSISFSGSDLMIDTINFHLTHFGVSTLNLNAIRKHVRNLYFDNCTGLTHLEISDGGSFENLECLSLYSSSIKSLGNDNSKFNCYHLNGNKVQMSALKRVASWKADGTVNSYTDFNFYYTKVEQITNINWIGTGAALFRDCWYLTSISGTLNISSSMSYMFYRCYVLASLPAMNNITVQDSVTDITYLFAACNALSYNDVVAVIKKCKKANVLTGALQAKQFVDNQTINLTDIFSTNTVHNNPDGTTKTLNLSNFLSQYRGSNTFPAITNNVTIVGKLPSNTNSAYWIFYGYPSIKVPYNILEGVDSLEDMTGMFISSTVTFTAPSGVILPTEQDIYEEYVTLTNCVRKDFFPANVKNIAQAFYGSNIITNDPLLFVNLSKLTNTNSTFGGNLKKFSFVNSHNETENINLDVSNMWNNNPLLENISGCFANVYNVFCNSLNFSQSIGSNKTINISGLFGLSNITYKDFCPISINIDDIVPILITDRQYAIPNNGSYAGNGTFQYRKITINTSNNNGQVLNKLSGQCRNMFYGSTLYLSTSVTTFNLTNTTYCDGMFYGARLYKLNSDDTHIYGIEDRKFVNVILPTRCSSYREMFRNSSILSDLPAINSSSASDLYYMYAGCVINRDNVELPNDYFEICSSNLSNVSGLFYNNMYLTTLQYGASRGLFEGCTNLSSTSSVFEGAHFLHKGVPNNLFGPSNSQLPRVTNLTRMFASTSIFFDVENDSHKWINDDTFRPLINLDNIQFMFYMTRINTNQFGQYGATNFKVKNMDEYVAIFDPYTFSIKTINNITSLFEHSRLSIESTFGGIKFKGFVQGDNAFFDTFIDNIGVPFVDSLYTSSIARANRMFYQNYTGGRWNSSLPEPYKANSIDGLPDFITELVKYPNTQKNNIAGNINDSSIPTIYKEKSAEAETNANWGFSLIPQTDVDAEAVVAVSGAYGHHIYT